MTIAGHLINKVMNIVQGGGSLYGQMGGEEVVAEAGAAEVCGVRKRQL